MKKPPFSIDAVMMGRNDEYEPNWNEKLMASIAYNRALFERSRVDYRITFVEWNPPAGKPLLAPMLVERFPYLRAIVVEPEVHEVLCESDQAIMLNFSLNCGLRTSTADYCLISAGDLFIGRQLADYIKGLGLIRNCLYRAERVNIRPDLDFNRITPELIEADSSLASIDTCTEPPYDVPPYFHACGDFLLTDRLSMQGIRGFDEGIRFARLHLDSRFCSTATAAGLNTNLAGQIFHISHTKSYTNQLTSYHDKPYAYRRGLPYLNGPQWGLADHVWESRGERLWSVRRPTKADGTVTMPFPFPENEVAAINAVTRRIIAAKNEQPPVEPDPQQPVDVRPIAVKGIRVHRDWPGARVQYGKPTVVETVSAPWGFSATLDIAKAVRRQVDNQSSVFVEIDMQATKGIVGVGLMTDYQLGSEIFLDAKDGRQRHYIGVSGSEDSLLIRNAAINNESSALSVHGVRVLKQRKTVIDESRFLL
ncbi:MAG TPA: hypothetical protein VFB13_19790 [Reyranella sp.]|jgi:hypothetical protein|nr:hypothetical protein [Reyranella sp.]